MDSPLNVRTVKRLDSRSLYELMQRRAGAGAMLVEWMDETCSYRSFVDHVRKCCAMFDSRRLARHQHILILTENERAAVSFFVAALLDGHVPTILAPDTKPARAKATAKLTNPALVIVDQSLRLSHDWIPPENLIGIPGAGRSGSGLLAGLGLFGGKPKTSLEEIFGPSEGRHPRCDSNPDDLAYVLFTSGTTSAPKGVMISHRNLFSHLATLSRVFAYDESSGIFNGMVLAHADGLVQGPLLALACGCRTIRPPAFSAQSLERHLNLVRAKQATHFLTVPTVYRLIDRYARHADYFEAEEFVALISVAAKLDSDLWHRLEDRFRRPVYNVYGLTETVTSALYAGPELGPPGTIGKPIDIEARLVRPDGSAAQPGETGEIWLRGDNVSPGYFANPEATAERYQAGFLKTGDIAICRADGAYEIRGRAINAINCGGFLINPDELDEALMLHPAVAEAATVGLPDDDFGEIPVSAVVLDKAADERELTDHCGRLLEARKVPKRIFVVPSIPRGDAAKPQLGLLAEFLVAAVGRERPDPASSSIADAILSIAARTFRVSPGELSLDSSPATIPTWDSFSHINLILDVERHFKKRIPAAEIVAIDSLRKLVAVVGRNP